MSPALAQELDCLFFQMSVTKSDEYTWALCLFKQFLFKITQHFEILPITILMSFGEAEEAAVFLFLMFHRVVLSTYDLKFNEVNGVCNPHRWKVLCRSFEFSRFNIICYQVQSFPSCAIKQWRYNRLLQFTCSKSLKKYTFTIKRVCISGNEKSV